MASKAELMAEAQRLGVRGRHSMTKADLSSALEARRNGQQAPARTSPARTRARLAAGTPRPTATAAPRIDLYSAASHGKVGPMLRGMSAERLTELAKRAGATVGEGAGAAELRKSIAAKAYDGVAASRRLAGYAPGAAPRAAAVLSRAKAAAPESAAKSFARGSWDVAREAVVGFANGGIRGGATAAARAVGSKGKVALGAAAVGYAGYEAYEGYKLDGLKGAGFGVVDGAINIISAGTLGGEFASRAIGYDYGKARRELAEKEAEKKAETEQKTEDAKAKADGKLTDKESSELINGGGTLQPIGFFGSTKSEHAKAVAEAASKDIKDGLKVAAGGVVAVAGGVAARKASTMLAKSADAGASRLGAAIKLSAAVPLRVGGKTAAVAGTLAAAGGIFHALTQPSVRDVPKSRSLFGQAGPENSHLNAAAAMKAAALDRAAVKPPAPVAGRPAGNRTAQPTGPATRSSYTTKDGRIVEATEGQARAYQARRISA